MDLKGVVALVTGAMAGWGSASATRSRRRAHVSLSCTLAAATKRKASLAN
jgi:NADP-dependent 3-hydroxy acid dehydrogenase YdfG